jgi:hypothetical protein
MIRQFSRNLFKPLPLNDFTKIKTFSLHYQCGYNFCIWPSIRFHFADLPKYKIIQVDHQPPILDARANTNYDLRKDNQMVQKCW